MKLLTAREMMAADRGAGDQFGISIATLMENAGTAVADAAANAARERDALDVAVVCGRGNNGGDGLVAARHLAARGLTPHVYLIGTAADLKSELLRGHAAAVAAAGIAVHEIANESAPPPLPSLAGFAVVVDAIFGTGFRPPASGLAATLIRDIEHARSLGSRVIAVDLPSGLDADHGHWEGAAASADVTVTFAAAKLAHFTMPAEERCGRVIVADIGIPHSLIDRPQHTIELVDQLVARALLPARRRDAHKGTHGRVLIVAGSRGKTGAAILAGRAALRVGAGLVTVATPASCLAIVAAGCPELMTEALAEDDHGCVAREAVPRLLALLATRDVLVIGPGLGLGDGTQHAIREVLASASLPTVVDADALTAIAANAKACGSQRGARVLTPHPGEASRLLASPTATVNRDRMASATGLAARAHAVVVLKGHRTITAKDDRVHVNHSGNPGLATAGTGDVLTGVIAGLIAQGLEPEAAATLGVYLHGAAADRIVARRGVALLLASEVEMELAATIAAVTSATHD